MRYVVSGKFWIQRDRTDAGVLVEVRQPLLTEHVIGKKEYFMVRGDVRLNPLVDGTFQNPVTGEIWLDRRLEC